ncbi:MAG: ankyrin repeat domain-containing protein [Candidatus Omnitrophica bacterium]|nr:ankyrin repeat domain-containing protein [Candidatus Omnitrophota bacterium]MCB9721018.1 ankyrin repeat domain-containing protein [Candidatus Omnitrophota bacterium]
MSLTLRITLALLLCGGLLPDRAAAQYTRDSIYTAARAGDYAAVEKFISRRVNQETLDNLLGAAVTGQQLDIIALLVNKGADPNSLTSYNSHLLNTAIMFGFDRSAAKLVELGADPNQYGYRNRERNVFIDWDWTPLMCAAFRGNEELVEILLAHGADPQLKGRSTSDVDIETAADIAAYSGHLDTLKLLLQKGAPLSRETIFKTVRGGHIKVFRFLLKQEDDLNRLSRQHRTLLMEAAWWGHEDIVKFLLRKGADVNYRTAAGETALLTVLSNPDRELNVQLNILKRLIRNGAVVGNDLPTARSLAQRYNKKPILAYLDTINEKGK